MATLLDGKQISQHIRNELKKKVSSLTIKPGLAVVLVGDDPASKVYVSNKEKACAEIGYVSQKIVLPDNVDEETLLEVIRKLNVDPTIHGILVQFPLPKHLAHVEEKIIRTIREDKDVDCFHPANVGKFATCKGIVCEDLLLPCTPAGILSLLHAYEIPIAGARVVILGRSNLVGKPIALFLLGEDATVTICHSKTKNMSEITKQADILIAAIGKPKFVTKDMVKPGVVVIDVGINRTEQGLVGDVDFEMINPIASAITPVPGGIGPMTIASLMQNVWKAYMKITTSL